MHRWGWRIRYYKARILTICPGKEKYVSFYECKWFKSSALKTNIPFHLLQKIRHIIIQRIVYTLTRRAITSITVTRQQNISYLVKTNMASAFSLLLLFSCDDWELPRDWKYTFVHLLSIFFLIFLLFNIKSLFKFILLYSKYFMTRYVTELLFIFT